jgi:hypothetical protein
LAMYAQASHDLEEITILGKDRASITVAAERFCREEAR